LAIYHLSIKIISRGKGGKSAVAAAAYRAGDKFTNERDGTTYDYTNKPGVIHTEILLPDHAPSEYLDRSTLWNAVEKIEKAHNSQLAREFEIAFPVELSMEQNISLARDYLTEHFVSKGMCVDLCIHDEDRGNPHAHVMLTMRPIEQDGTWGAKSKKEYILDENGEKIKLKSGEYKSRKVNTVDWNDQTKAEEWRAAWSDITNRYLKQSNRAERIDHRSYERQGSDQVPTIHMGVAASQMEKKGIRTNRGDINRQAEITNNQMRQLRARIRKSKDCLYSVPIPDAPSMIDVMSRIADGRNLETRWQKIRSLQTQASVLMFIQQHNITDMAQLVNTIESINEKYKDLADNIKKAERRLDTLSQHIAQYEIRKNNRAVYNEYAGIMNNPKKREAYYAKHEKEIEAFKDAREYLNAVMNGRTDPPPIKDWRKEYERLTAAKYALCERYYALQDEVRSVEQLRRGAENIMRDESQERQRTRAQGMEI
jgi:ATP-dependent exoDNAse (exonuclease V) alpha subunit